MSGRYTRADTHETDFAGSVRQIQGHPGVVFDNTDYEEFAVGSVVFDTVLSRFYINFDGTTGGWKKLTLT